ncbi:MAG: hypothetical protein AAF487_10125 [Bacteroidota bacterium]
MGSFNPNKLFITASLLLSVFCGFGQSPFGINYQAIARNTDTGNEIVNDDISVQFEIRSASFDGDVVYQEVHSSQTNDFGLFRLVIGMGQSTSGDFSSINWSNGSYFVATFIDDGNGFEEISVVQLLSVPFALHANTVSNANDDDADPSNEYNLDLSFDANILSIDDLGGQLSVDLSALDDNDGDPENERITDFSLNGFELNITESGQNNTVNLSPIIPSSFWLENGTGGLYHISNSRVGIGENNSVPNSTLDINGSVSYQTQGTGSISNLVVNESEHHYLINNNGPVSIELPNSANVVGREYVFIFQNNVSHPIEFLPLNSTIQNAPTITFPSSHGEQVYTVISFGISGWYFKTGL